MLNPWMPRAHSYIKMNICADNMSPSERNVQLHLCVNGIDKNLSMSLWNNSSIVPHISKSAIGIRNRFFWIKIKAWDLRKYVFPSRKCIYKEGLPWALQRTKKLQTSDADRPSSIWRRWEVWFTQHLRGPQAASERQALRSPWLPHRLPGARARVWRGRAAEVQDQSDGSPDSVLRQRHQGNCMTI